MERKRLEDEAPAARLQKDKYRVDLARLERSLLDRPARTSPEDRRAAAQGRGSGEALGQYLAKVHEEAYRVTDEELAGLRGGRSDDELFELTVSAAYGAARRRLDAALGVVAAAFDEEGE